MTPFHFTASHGATLTVTYNANFDTYHVHAPVGQASEVFAIEQGEARRINAFGGVAHAAEAALAAHAARQGVR